MSEIKVIMNDGSEHIVPETNLANVQKISGHLIKKIVRLNNNNQAPPVNRIALEGVVKREFNWSDEKIKKATDSELLTEIRNPQPKAEAKQEVILPPKKEEKTARKSKKNK